MCICVCVYEFVQSHVTINYITSKGEIYAIRIDLSVMPSRSRSLMQ